MKLISLNAPSYSSEQNQVSWGYLFLLFLSYFFTHQVIQNTLHCVVAGTVGTWWFSPSDSGCGAVLGSLCRSLTTSFGSICFGSLLVAIVQATRALANAARDNDNQILVCIATCILACLESILEYFNKWVSWSFFHVELSCCSLSNPNVPCRHLYTLVYMDTVTSKQERVSWVYSRTVAGRLLLLMIWSAMVSKSKHQLSFNESDCTST